ncbi:MAG: flagellar assembly protein FliW [Helicobacteraceae bacterium]|jgi:flagellar assembly factor FliW|nr:flagellar assembly protein FliW [Helicobacteraceae bacterium]
MIYSLKSPILGFEQVKEVEFNESDELFATIADASKSGLIWTLINPYRLREYSFDLSADLQKTLGINENSQTLVYNILALGQATDDSEINFLAPIVFNKDNALAAQIVLDVKKYPDFGAAQKLSEFVVKAQ